MRHNLTRSLTPNIDPLKDLEQAVKQIHAVKPDIAVKKRIQTIKTTILIPEGFNDQIEDWLHKKKQKRQKGHWLLTLAAAELERNGIDPEYDTSITP